MIIELIFFLNPLTYNFGSKARFNVVFVKYKKYDLKYVKTEFNFEKSQRVYIWDLNPEKEKKYLDLFSLSLIPSPPPTVGTD